jgi:serine/threonine protein kinase
MKYCSSCKTSYPTDFQVCPKDGAGLNETNELLSGMIIREKYQILEKIGSGGMAAVYRARHVDFNEIFAIKLINNQYFEDESFIKRLRAEAVIARKLRHPHAVRIEDLDRTEDGRLFIVMEYVDGQDLRRVIRQNGALPVQRILDIASQVCSALAAAHALGIVHRDIKPDNIQLLATTDGTDFVKVLDFGIAKLRRGAANDESLTGSGLLLGTPQYLSPEQAMGKTGTHIDGRSDLYSLGIVMYEMLTGRVPFQSDTPMGMLVHHLHTLPQPPQKVRPDLDIPQPVSELLMQCLQKCPEDRFQSADQMLTAVRTADARLGLGPQAAATAAASTRTDLARTATVGSAPLPPPEVMAAAGIDTDSGTRHELLTAAFEGERHFPWRVAAVLGGMLVVGILAGIVFSHSGWVSGTRKHRADTSQKSPAPSPAPTQRPPAPAPASVGVQANRAPAVKVGSPVHVRSRLPAGSPVFGRSGESPVESDPAAKMPAILRSVPTTPSAQIASGSRPGSQVANSAQPLPRIKRGVHKTPVSPEMEGLLAEAQSFMDNGDYDTAMQQYEDALKLDPANAAAIAGKKKASEAKEYEHSLDH